MLSVVIPTIVRPELIQLFENLRRQSYKDFQVVIDLKGTNLSEKRKRGASDSFGSIIVFLDDDLILKEDFLEKGIEQFQNYSYDFAQSKVRGGINNSEDKFVGASMWFKRDVYEKVSEYIDFNFYNEDIVLYLTALKMKYKCGYLDESIAWHRNLGNYEKLIEANKQLEKRFPDFYNKLKKEAR